MRSLCMTVVVCAVAGTCLADASSFPLPDGTTWCFLGDSIGGQNYHNNYIESYYQLRFPANRYHFRGCWRGGSTLPEALDRFDAHVAIWEPDVVSLEMGLNGNALKPEFTANLNIVTDRTEALGAESVYFSMHPMHTATGGSDWIQNRADAFVEVAPVRGLLAVDQFHDLLPIFTGNASSPDPVDLGYVGGDTGHPGPAGHMIKTWDILTSMGAPAEVSSARINAATGTLASSSHCTVSGVTKTATGVTFTRDDDRLPIAFDPDGLAALELVPTLLDDISAYMVQVDGLAPGDYRVLIDGVESAVLSAAELAAGYNMTQMTEGPIHDQLMLVRQMILEKEGYDPGVPLSVLKRRLQGKYYEDLYDIHGQELVDFMKGLHPTLPQPVGLTTDILPLDEAIHLAAQPGAHDFEIELVPEPATLSLLAFGGLALIRRRRS